MTVAPVAPAKLADALALLYGPGANEDLGHAFRLVARGELNPADVLVARRDEELVGAVFASRVPGGLAVIWPPRAVGDDATTKDALTTAALEHVSGAKAVQAFLPPQDIEWASPLQRAGFRHVTRVWQMATPTGDGELGRVIAGSASRLPLPTHPALTRPGSPLIEFVAYPYADPSTFHTTLLRAHDDSLDCPELHGLLSQDEFLASYRDSAPDPAQWWLALVDKSPGGVLLMNGDELTFLGVVPERRGQGIGRYLLELALGQSSTLTLIVDARNSPAFRLYRAGGLEVVGAREVFLYLPPLAAGKFDPRVRGS